MNVLGLLPASLPPGEPAGSAAWYVAAGLVFIGVSGAFAVAALLLRPLDALVRRIRLLPVEPENHGEHSGRPDVPAEIAEVERSISDLLAGAKRDRAWRQGYVAALLHDLKTPLVGCMHIVATLTSRAGGFDARAASDLIQIERALGHVVAATQRMIDAIRLDRDDVSLARTEVDVGELTRSVVADVLRATGADVRVDVEGDLTIRADAMLLRRALQNMIDNAVRSARSRVAIEILPGLVRLSDNGMGLPEPLDQLTQPFRSAQVAEAGGSGEFGSAGIGLFIVRRVLEAHGGHLALEHTSSAGTTLLAYLGPSVPIGSPL